jgi:hypothetical protein
MCYNTLEELVTALCEESKESFNVQSSGTHIYCYNIKG